MPPWRTTLLAAATALLACVPAADAAFTVRGSVGQAYVLDAKRGERLVLLRGSRVVASGRADRFGSKIFRELRARSGYRVRRADGTRSRPFAVLDGEDAPPQSFFRRTKLKAGLNYVKMRDGVELAMTVRLPPGKSLGDGPFPTLIEHSGYAVAAPGSLLDSIVASITGGSAKPDPLAPAGGTVVGSVVAPLVGFAVVSVQMRGSGCSGGAFDLFDRPTTYDGYDAVETVAAQSWVKGRKVGMAGISFSGITQLFAAGTQPPHLAAIAPLSVGTESYQGLSWPGGIRNTGFIQDWIDDRQSDARPAPQGGQQWARILARRGDRRCRANQKLRLQTQNARAEQARNPFRTPSIYEQRGAQAWMSRIEVPTFLAGQFQDEQTGGHFPMSLGLLARNPKVWITLQNGVHVDSLGPDVITRWLEFLKLYVADEIPEIPAPILSLGGALYRYLADADAKPIVQSRFAGTTDLAAARAVFERDPRVRILMENGTGPTGPGTLGSSWELGFSAWPIREVRPTPWFFGPGGVLAPERPAQAVSATYTGDARARPRQTLPGSGEGDAWKAQPRYDWRPVAAGKGVGFTTAPLAEDVVIAGSSSADLVVSSSARDADLQVTLSEVRPDGNEVYVQSGWLRASHRKLDARRSTPLQPEPTHLARDAAPLVPGRPALVRVPIFPVAHAFRKDSRIRVTVQAPGGERPRWAFEDTLERGRTRTTIASGSSLVLPVVAGATAQGTPLRAPTALRGQPSRRYVPATNGG